MEKRKKIKKILLPQKELDELIEKSTIQIMTHQLFVHYLSDNLKENPNDPSWKNQAVFFWKGHEKFERKSLPPEFRNYQKYYFIINAIPKEFRLNQGKAMPWFGMEGNGDKYFFSSNNAEIPLQELVNKNIIQYVDLPKLTLENAHILTDRAHYFWLMNREMIGFKNNQFQFNGNTIAISKAVEMGGLQLIQIKKI